MIYPIIHHYLSYETEKASLNKSGINLGKGYAEKRRGIKI
jgi:hypothetical protein